MPRNPSTGEFTRVDNTFSNPVNGTPIQPGDAQELFNDYDAGLNNIPADQITGQIAVENGGTGADNATGARSNLGLGSAAVENASSFATAAQGALANTALQPREPIIVTANGAISAETGAVAIQKTSPTTTSLTLPSVANQAGIPLSIFDWSSSVTDHAITLTPAGSETIMKASSWSIYSNSSQLASVTLYPSTTLNGWFIAP